MSSVNNPVLKPKAKKSKQNQKNKVIRDDKKTHYTKLSSMSRSNQSADTRKYIISCRSCFWGTPLLITIEAKLKLIIYTRSVHHVLVRISGIYRYPIIDYLIILVTI